jgi:hypothetical protein
MIWDVRYRYPRAYHHRHKCHVRPDGFGQEGPSEIHALLTKIEQMLMDNNQEFFTSFRTPQGILKRHAMNKIYPTHPHGTADNHFSGDHVLDFAGERGFGLTLTQRKDRFPSGLKPYCHHEKAEASKVQRYKVMRFGNPIVAICNVSTPDENKKDYTKTLVSFQSTGATNICGVNNLPSCNLSVRQKVRGAGDQKRVWGIEMNEARATYLDHYYAVDNVDHMIKNAGIRFVSWKYWHAAFNHGHAMAVVASYDMYQQACDGLLDPDWILSESERMSFRDWRMQLSEDMLNYNPANGLLPGDEYFRVSTKQTIRRRQREKKRKKDNVEYAPDGITLNNYKLAKTTTSRLCGDLDQFLVHSKSLERTTNHGRCEVCNKKTLWKCRTCDKFVCVFEKKSFTGGECMVRYHSDTFFGLAKCDAGMHDSVNWKPANENTIRRHAVFMKAMQEQMRNLEEADGTTVPVPV